MAKAPDEETSTEQDFDKVQEILAKGAAVTSAQLEEALPIFTRFTSKLDIGDDAYLATLKSFQNIFPEFLEQIQHQEGISSDTKGGYKKITEELNRHILEYEQNKGQEQEAADFIITTPSDGRQKQRETGQASSTQLADSSGPTSHEITEAIRREILEKQRQALMLSFAAKDSSGNLAFKGDEEFRKFLKNSDNAVQISEMLADTELKTRLEKIEVDGYKTVHTRFKDSFKPMNWGDKLADSADKTSSRVVKSQIVRGANQEELCTLNSTTHQSDAQINGDLAVKSYRTIEFPRTLENAATMHLSLAVQDVNGRNMREPAVFFTAHYEEGNLVEVSSPIPVKFGSEDDNAVGYIERNGQIYTLPVTQKEYREMMAEVSKNLGQGINNSQVMSVESVDKAVVQAVTPDTLSKEKELSPDDSTVLVDDKKKEKEQEQGKDKDTTSTFKQQMNNSDLRKAFIADFQNKPEVREANIKQIVDDKELTKSEKTLILGELKANLREQAETKRIDGYVKAVKLVTDAQVKFDEIPTVEVKANKMMQALGGGSSSSSITSPPGSPNVLTKTSTTQRM